MGTNWISGAERLGDGDIGGDMDSPNRPSRVVWHTTESGAGDAAFNAVAAYLVRIGAEPHILYDPTTDRIGQFGPLSDSARALRNDGATRTNRTGKVCIQIEVLARAGKPFTGYWKPGPNFRKLMAAIRSWGVPDRFPLPLAERYGGGTRTRSVWPNTAGHYGHSNVPGNDHWDPGAISTSALFKAAPTATPAPAATYTVRSGDTLSGIGAKVGVKWQTIASANGIKAPYVIKPGQVLKLGGAAPTPKPVPAKPAAALEPFPGAAFFKRAPRSAIITAMGKRLVAEGYRGYAEGPGPQWTEADRRAYAWWQRKLGYSGKGADGWPGAASWAKLKVPNV